ncbi:uncharacterized protein [Clytia hemisphaerica]|uniref:Uncharacterized protein n=1 Tax=Clytia hemisphaerica TaxID=252671 RepID=A0A7M5XKM6_9CNID
MRCCHILGVSIIFILSVAAVGLLVASGVAYDVLIEDSLNGTSSSRIGLWRNCTTMNGIETCSVDDNILEFKSEPNMRRDKDILIVMDIAAVAIILIAIFLTLCGLAKSHRSKCVEITASLLFILATICILFMVVYLEVEMIKDSSFKRGWAVFTLYGGLAATLLTSVEAIVYALCCYDPYLEGIEKSDSLVLRSRPPNLEYNRSYNNNAMDTSYNPYAVPTKDY